jgi:UDP:flavonoid glycosyltransferase YjiC (YdhE family)
VAARVTACGAGVRVKRSASPAKIAAAVREVLDDPSYRAAARRMAEAIATETREDRAAAELEAVARTARPQSAAPTR